MACRSSASRRTSSGSCASSWGWAGGKRTRGVATVARSGTMTMVPATRSPRRWKRRVADIDTSPAMDRRPPEYVSGSASAARSTFRSAAARKPMGLPVAVTTRSPSARLPGVRPCQASSTAKYSHWIAKSTTRSSPIPVAAAPSAASLIPAVPTNASITSSVRATKTA